jgi:hypothetical protein
MRQTAAIRGGDGMSKHWRRFDAISALRWVLLLTLWVGANASALEVTGLYDVTVTPQDRSRDSAFTEALRQVAVRVSGDRNAAARVVAANPDARRYVQRFSFKPDGTVAVGYDSATVERLLTNANLPIWGRERPATLVWLNVPDAAGRSTWAGSGWTGPERDAIEAAARARGLPLVWPAMDAQDISAVTGLMTARDADQLLASGARYRADAVLLGMASRDAAGTYSVRWSFSFNGEQAEFQGGLEDGVHLAADRCAKVLAVMPGARSDVRVRVAGIANLEAYARTLNYLEGLTLVRAVAVEQLESDVLDMRVTVRGDAPVLRKTIAMDRRFTPDRESADGALSFRFVN